MGSSHFLGTLGAVLSFRRDLFRWAFRYRLWLKFRNFLLILPPLKRIDGGEKTKYTYRLEIMAGPSLLRSRFFVSLKNRYLQVYTSDEWLLGVGRLSLVKNNYK